MPHTLTDQAPWPEATGPDVQKSPGGTAEKKATQNGNDHHAAKILTAIQG